MTKSMRKVTRKFRRESREITVTVRYEEGTDRDYAMYATTTDPQGWLVMYGGWDGVSTKPQRRATEKLKEQDFVPVGRWSRNA